MIERLIHTCIRLRVLVVLLAVLLAVAGWASWKATPLDAIPDLSDTQVIVKTSYPGQSPQVVQDQVTYPLTTRLLAVPGSTAGSQTTSQATSRPRVGPGPRAIISSCAT